MKEGAPTTHTTSAAEEHEEPVVDSPEAEKPEVPAAEPEAQELSAQGGKHNKGEKTVENFKSDFERLKEREDMGSDAKGTEYRRLARNIDDRRSDLVTKAKGEQSQLQVARAKLGLAETSPESTHSERSDSGEIRELDRLRDDVESEFRENNRAIESVEREKRFKEGAREVSDAAAMFAREVVNRSQNGMDPFIEVQDFNTFKSAAHTLSEFSESKGVADMDQLSGALNRLSYGLGRMDRTRRTGAIRENEDSLNRLSHATRSIYEATVKLGTGFREGDEKLSVPARRLIETSDRAWIFAGRIRSALRNMR